MVDETHQFERRVSDVNVSSLALRMTGLEGRLEVLERDSKAGNEELRANTKLTGQVHEAVFGKEEDVGVQGRVSEMYDIFEATRNGFRMLAAIGNFGLKAIETGGKYAKPLFWIIAVGAGALTWFKTGAWSMPEWWAWFK